VIWPVVCVETITFRPAVDYTYIIRFSSPLPCQLASAISHSDFLLRSCCEEILVCRISLCWCSFCHPPTSVCTSKQWRHATGAHRPSPNFLFFFNFWVSLFLGHVLYFTWAWTSFFWVLSPNCILSYSNSALHLRFLSALFSVQFCYCLVVMTSFVS